MSVIFPLLYLFVIMHNFKQTYADPPDCNFTQPHSKTNCTPVFWFFQSLFSKPNCQKNAKYICSLKGISDYKSCYNRMLLYFKDVYDDEVTINKYLNEGCHNYDINVCVDMIIILKDFCYDMRRAVELTKAVPSLYLQVFPKKNTTIEKFDLPYSSWKEYGGKEYGGIEIEKCIGYVEKTIEALRNSYIGWFQSKHGKADCNCVEILGINGMYSDRNPKESKKLKDSAYNYFCYDGSINDSHPSTRQHVWHIKQIITVAESGKLSNDDKVQIMKLGSPIAEAGWLIMPNSDWHVMSLFHHLTANFLYPNSSYKERAELIGAAIKAGFSEDEFLTFSDNTNVDGFKSSECKREIIHDVFNKFMDDKHYWKQTSRSIFTQNIVNLIKIFKKTYPNEDCSSFIGCLGSFRELSESGVSADKFNFVLEKGLTSNTKFGDLFDLLDE